MITQEISLDAKVIYNKGNEAADRGDYKTAIANYSEAIRLAPNYAKAYFNRADAFDELGEFDKAIADYSEVVRIEQAADAYKNRGLVFYKKGDLDKALSDIGEAYRLDRNDDTLLLLEKIRIEQGGMGKEVVTEEKEITDKKNLDKAFEYAQSGFGAANKKETIEHYTKAVGDGEVYQPGVGLFEGPLSGRGKCKITYSNADMPEGSYYEGECADTKPDGWGTHVVAGQYRQTGEWRGGEPHGYSVTEFTDAHAALGGVQEGYTAEGIEIDGVLRYRWIRHTKDGKAIVERATDDNFEIPQEDLPLSLNARLFMGFIDMYQNKMSEFEKNLNNLNSERDLILKNAAEFYKKNKERNESIMAWPRNASALREITKLANEMEREANRMSKLAEKYESRTEEFGYQINSLCELSTQPIEKKAEAYYDWLVEQMQVAKSEQEYVGLAKKFSEISEYKDCAIQSIKLIDNAIASIKMPRKPFLYSLSTSSRRNYDKKVQLYEQALQELNKQKSALRSEYDRKKEEIRRTVS